MDLEQEKRDLSGKNKGSYDQLSDLNLQLNENQRTFDKIVTKLRMLIRAILGPNFDDEYVKFRERHPE